MRSDNPAVFECPKSTGGVHRWRRMASDCATCVNCKLELSAENTTDLLDTTESWDDEPPQVTNRR